MLLMFSGTLLIGLVLALVVESATMARLERKAEALALSDADRQRARTAALSRTGRLMIVVECALFLAIALVATAAGIAESAESGVWILFFASMLLAGPGLGFGAVGTLLLFRGLHKAGTDRTVSDEIWAAVGATVTLLGPIVLLLR